MNKNNRIEHFTIIYTYTISIFTQLYNSTYWLWAIHINMKILCKQILIYVYAYIILLLFSICEYRYIEMQIIYYEKKR